MKRFIFVILFASVATTPCIAQTSYILQKNPIDYNDIDDNFSTPVVDEYDVIVDDCTSISFEIDYFFSDGWDVGNPQMESSSACPGCAGDPDDPAGGGCEDCWDFMFIEFLLDGTPVYQKLIGSPSCLEQFGTVSFGPVCVNLGVNASIRITNSNWEAHETNSYQNVTINCWEGAPSVNLDHPICPLDELTLIGWADDLSTVVGWEWNTNGNSTINSPNSQNTFATNVTNGEYYTLTTTDVNNCSATNGILVIVIDISAELSGDGDLCENSCLEDFEYLELEIDGGIPPYNVTLTINDEYVNFPFTVGNSTFIQICHDDNVSSPKVEAGDPVIITVPNSSPYTWPLDIGIGEVSDVTGCEALIIGDNSIVVLYPTPDITEPDIMPKCIDSDDLIDLTMYNPEILNGGPGEVIWLESDDVLDIMPNPDQYEASGNDKVYVVVFDDPCYSEILTLCLDISIRPEIDDIVPISNCGEEYTLQNFEELAEVKNGFTTSYFLDDVFSDGPYFPGDIIDLKGLTKIYIYSESNVGCFASEPIDVFIRPIPEISSVDIPPACHFIVLPQPEIQFFDNYSYNTAVDGSGKEFADGDLIYESDMISMLWVIATTTFGCRATEPVTLSYLPNTDYKASVPRYNCDELILPNISPTAPGVEYFVNSDGRGDSYLPGETITFALANSTSNILDTLYLIDDIGNAPCDQVDTIVFEILKTPALNNLGDLSFCGPGTLPQLPQGSTVEYSDSPMFINILDPNEPILASTTIYARDRNYFSDGINNCEVLDTFEMKIVYEPNAGRDTSIVICEGYNTVFNLNSLLDFPDNNGTYSDSGIPNLSLSNISAVDFSQIPVGSHQILYTIDTPPCPVKESTISIEVYPAPFIPVANSDIIFCSRDTEYDLVDILQNPSTGGNYFAIGPANSEIPIIDPTTFTINSVPNAELTPGIIRVVYDIPGVRGNPYCDGLRANILFTEGDKRKAGEDATTTVCRGAVLDLSNLLTNADPGGVFETNLPLTGTIWDTNIPVNGGPDYEVEYIQNNINCPSDTANFLITLSDELSAGTPEPNIEVCAAELVDLSDFITGESLGGNFYFSNNLNNPIPDLWTADVQTNFTYIIEGSLACESDTSMFTVEVIEGIVATANYSTTSLCANEDVCAELIIKSNTDGSAEIDLYTDPNLGPRVTVFVDIVNGCGVLNLCPGGNFSNSIVNDSISLTSEIRLIEIKNIIDGSGKCDNLPFGQADDFRIYVDYDETHEAFVCQGEAATINGQDFYVTETLELTSQNGCDSIVNVIIDYFPQETRDLTVRRCTGQQYEVLGQVFTRDTIAELIFFNASVFGCDSTINIDLLFQDVAIGTYEQTICRTASIIVDDVTFDINNSIAQVPYSGGSAFGCDSATMVTIDFFSLAEGEFVTDFCAEDMDIEIGGDTYNENKLSGTSILTGASSNGCDSLVNVTLTLNPSTEEDDSRSFCEDEEIEVNGMVFTINNPSGIAPGKNQFGCDSIINVDFTFIPGSETDYELELCVDKDIEVNGVIFNMANPSGPALGYNQFGCDSLINVNLVFNYSTYSSSTFICPGTDTGILTIEESQGISFPAELYIDELDLTRTINRLPYDLELVEGTYTITLSDGECIATSMITIESEDPEDIIILSNLLGDNIHELEYQTLLDPISINWTPARILSCTECEMPVATITDTTIVTLDLMTDDGCTYSQEIILNYIDSSLIIYTPNIITENDPANDRFFVQSNYDRKIDLLSIYDRWGNLVFYNEDFVSNRPDQGWDGRMNGGLVEQGVYVFYIEYVDRSGQTQIEAGSLTVIR